MLFKRSYSKTEFDDIARNTPDKNRYYFYSIHKHNLSSLCDRNITDVTKYDSTITIKETLNECNIIATHGHNYNPRDHIATFSYEHKLDDILIVTNSGYDLSIDQGIYVMPAYAYYLLIKAANDRQIEQNLQSLFFAVTAITPFDEFFLIGKALKYSYKGLKSVNYAKARNLLDIKPCVLKPKYKKLFAGHTEKLKKYVKFGEDVANTTGVLKLIDRLGDYKGIRNKLESFNDNALKSKFLNDFAESGDEIWKKLDANDGKLVDSWKKLDDLGLYEAIRRNPLHLEATKKLEDLKLHTNPIEADKLIKNINEGIDQIGDNGKIILDKIKSGEFESISGYNDLIQGIKKVSDNAINSNVANELAQTFRHLDNTSSVPNSRKVLGHKSTTDPKFDIDYAEKSTGGSKLYDKAYQFKTTNDPFSVHNRLKLDKLKTQLMNIDAKEKVLSIEIRNGSISDVESGKYFFHRLERAKKEIIGFKLIITDINGSVLKIY